MNQPNVTLQSLTDLDLKSLREANKILKETKLKWSNYEIVEIRMKDPHGTIIQTPKIKFDKAGGESFFRKKYKRLYKLTSVNDLIIHYVDIDRLSLRDVTESTDSDISAGK